MCRYSAFEGPAAVTKMPKYTLLSKGSTIATVMWKCLAFNMVPNSN